MICLVLVHTASPAFCEVTSTWAMQYLSLNILVDSDWPLQCRQSMTLLLIIWVRIYYSIVELATNTFLQFELLEWSIHLVTKYKTSAVGLELVQVLRRQPNNIHQRILLSHFSLHAVSITMRFTQAHCNALRHLALSTPSIIH